MTDKSRTKDFRYIYSNAQRIQINGQEVIILFGIKEDLTASDEKILDEVGIAMTPSAAKQLAMMLTRTIEHVEASTNSIIPINQSKLEQLEDILRVASAASSPPSEQSAPVIPE